jgi:hypothetical protein
MNLDDLRRELRTRASEPLPTSMSDRLAGVQAKVTVARRRKAVASAAATLVTLTVVGFAATQFVGGGDGDEMADAELVQMPQELNGDLQIAARYNEGAGDLSWTVPLDDLDVVTRTTCLLPAGAALPNADAPVMLSWTIDGGTPVSGQYSTQCGTADDPSVSTLGPTTREDWREIGAQRDGEVQIQVQLQQDALPIEVPGAQFGIALYDKTGERVTSDGVELPVRIDVDGETYELLQEEEDFKTQRLTESAGRDRVLRLQTPASDAPLAVYYGWDSDIPTASYDLKQDGEQLDTGYGGHLESPRLIDADTEHRLALRARGASADGVLVLAYYELVDD